MGNSIHQKSFEQSATSNVTQTNIVKDDIFSSYSDLGILSYKVKRYMLQNGWKHNEYSLLYRHFTHGNSKYEYLDILLKDKDSQNHGLTFIINDDDKLMLSYEWYGDKRATVIIYDNQELCSIVLGTPNVTNIIKILNIFVTSGRGREGGDKKAPRMKEIIFDMYPDCFDEDFILDQVSQESQQDVI